jgi:hypothetical protein
MAWRPNNIAVHNEFGVTRAFVISVTGFLVCAACPAQKTTLSFQTQIVRSHTLLPHPDHFRGIPQDGTFPLSVPLRLRVSPAGQVTDVALGTDSKGSLPDTRHFDWEAIQRTARRWHYTPFMVEGKPVTASIDTYALLVGPRKQPSRQIVPPTLKPDSRIVISLERTRCYGSCPAYKLTVDASSVEYEGIGYTAVEGIHRDVVDVLAVRRLAQRFIDAGFFFFDDRYTSGWTDGTTYILSISIDGYTKTVSDYGGLSVGMPFAVSELEEAVDILARSDRWVVGREGLVQNLKAEGYDFHTADAQAILQRTLERDQPDTVEELLEAGVPLQVLPGSKMPEQPLGFDPTKLDWLTVASGSPAVLPLLLRAQVNEHEQHDKDYALGRAAGAGDLTAARQLIRYGADPKAIFTSTHPQGDRAGAPPETVSNGSVLTRAAGSGSPELLREILEYRPNLEIRDTLGRTAVFAAAEGRYGIPGDGVNRVACLKLLAAVGADPNARDNKGDSALWSATTDDVREQLLKMGVQINARNNHGETVLFSFFDPKALPFLISHGIDLNAVDNFGEDPIRSWHRRHISAPEFEKALQAARQHAATIQ